MVVEILEVETVLFVELAEVVVVGVLVEELENMVVDEVDFEVVEEGVCVLDRLDVEVEERTVLDDEVVIGRVVFEKATETEGRKFKISRLALGVAVTVTVILVVKLAVSVSVEVVVSVTVEVTISVSVEVEVSVSVEVEVFVSVTIEVSVSVVIVVVVVTVVAVAVIAGAVELNTISLAKQGHMEQKHLRYCNGWGRHCNRDGRGARDCTRCGSGAC